MQKKPANMLFVVSHIRIQAFNGKFPGGTQHDELAFSGLTSCIVCRVLGPLQASTIHWPRNEVRQRHHRSRDLYLAPLSSLETRDTDTDNI